MLEGGLVPLASEPLTEVWDLEAGVCQPAEWTVLGMDLSLATVTSANLLELPGILQREGRRGVSREAGRLRAVASHMRNGRTR